MSGDSTAATLAGTSAATVPSADAGKCQCYLTTYDGQGAPRPGTVVSFQLRSPPTGFGASYVNAKFSTTSDGDALAQLPLVRGGRYWYWAVTGSYKEAVVPDQALFALGNL